MTLPATVVQVDETGPDAVVTLEVAAEAVRAPGTWSWETGATGRARLRTRFPRNTTVTAGQTLPIAVDATQVHVFDPVTGRALHHPEDPTGLS